MTEPVIPGTTTAEVVDNPTKPWKAIAAFVAPAILAAIQKILDLGVRDMPLWLWLVLSGAAAGVSVYVVKNPKTVKKVLGSRRTKRAHGERGETTLVVVVAVIVLVLFVALVLIPALRR